MSNLTSRAVKALLALVVGVVGLVGIASTTSAAPTAKPAAVAQASCGDTSGFPVVALGSLPPEATDTYNLIQSDGPYPYPQDGTVFDNREGLLPACSSGYYHEYTVETPGSPDRGTRRIIGGNGGEYFYTDDHYESFSLIDVSGGGGGGTECGDTSGLTHAALSSLPAEVAQTIDAVKAGGPFDYPNDGTVYQNREAVLPACSSGYYHLYTVPTNGQQGDRRLITGAGGEYFYTPDDYGSFVAIDGV
jgi:guanyl-specific ribonuclease Sa